MEENDLRNYLLGRLPDEQSEKVETQALDNDEFFLTLRGVEDDLFDAFARGELRGDDREAFLRKFGIQTDRIAFATALANRQSNVAVFPSRQWVGWAAAAAVIVFGLSALLLRSPAPPASVTPAIRAIAVTIPLAESRSASATPQIDVPLGVSVVNLRLRLNPADRYPAYAVGLRSNRSAWHAENLHASTIAGDLVLTAPIPASAIPDGSYDLAVSGGGQDLGFMTVEVHRKR